MHRTPSLKAPNPATGPQRPLPEVTVDLLLAWVPYPGWVLVLVGCVITVTTESFCNTSAEQRNQFANYLRRKLPLPANRGAEQPLRRRLSRRAIETNGGSVTELSPLVASTTFEKDIPQARDDEELVNVFLRCNKTVCAFGVVKSSAMLVTLFYALPLEGGWARYNALGLSVFCTGQLYHLLLQLCAIVLPPLDSRLIGADRSILESIRSLKHTDSWAMLEDLGKALAVEDVRTVLVQGLTFMLVGCTFAPFLVSHIVPGVLAYFWLFAPFGLAWLSLRDRFYRATFLSPPLACAAAWGLKVSFLFLSIVALQQSFVLSALYLYGSPPSTYLGAIATEFRLRPPWDHLVLSARDGSLLTAGTRLAAVVSTLLP